MRLKHFLSVFLTLLTLSIGQVWGEVWVKVTAAPTAPATWAGEYLIVYESSATAGVAWTGVDAVSSNVAVTISNGVISTKPENAKSVTITAMNGGYSLRVNGGTNDGKYMKNASNNGISFQNSAQANTLTYENSSVTISCGGKNFRYNKDNNNWRFRYFGSAQQKIQLYKKCYTVTYNKNGGTGTMTDSNSPYAPNATVTVLDNAFTAPDGKTFDGWNSKADGSGGDFGATFTITQDTTLYAQWASSGCAYKVNISAGTPEAGASFVLSKTGEQNCCEALTINVTNITAPEGKRFKRITETGNIAAANVEISQANKTVTYAATSSGDSEINVEFEEIPSHKINFNNNGGSVTPAYVSVKEGETYSALPSVTGLTSSCEYGTFVGWTTASSITPSVKPALVTSVTMSTSDVNLYAVYSKTEGGSIPVEDQLTPSVISNPSTYTSWSGKSATSDAVYAGCSTGGSTYIQLRISDNESGIVSTTSGGNCSKVTVDWNNTTTTSRYVDVYGKNSAYASSADLYDNSKAGTLIGTLSKDNGDTELEISGDYAYIGIRSQTGAIYLNSVTFTWGGGGTTTYSLDANCCTPHTITTSVVGGTLTLSPNVAEACANTAITLTANSPDGNHEGNATIVVTDDDDDDNDITADVLSGSTLTMPSSNITITATYAAKSSPSVTITDGEEHPVSALNFGSPKKGDDVPAAKTFVIDGTSLTSALTVVSSEPSLYAVSYAEGALTPDANKEVEATITITPQAGITSTAGTKSADITISGGGLASSVVVTASMTVQQTYTVNWWINGGVNPAASQTDIVGTTLNIPSDFSEFTDCSSFTFLGWKDGSAIDGGSSTTAPTLATVGTEITAADKNYYAVFAEGNPGGYAKVTAVNQLAANDKIVIAYNDERAMKAYNGSANYYDTAVIVVADNKITSLGNAFEFTLGGEEDAWTFSDGTYYVYSAGSAKSGGGYNNNMKGQTELTDAGRWTIAIVNGVTSITSNGNSATPNMRYNTSNPRFSCYNSGQSAVDIYRKTAPIYTKYYTTCPGKVAKPEISGVTEGETYDEEQTITITCGTSDATILYSIDGNAPATAYTAPFKLSANGSYTIRAKATKTDFTDSDEATAISFTIDKPFTTIRALIEANLEAQTSASIVFTPESNAIITAVNSTNRYIQDASGYGIVIRSSEWNEAAVQEKKITGKITGSWKVYNGQMQLENATFANDVAFTDSELPTASTVTAIDAETFAAHPTALVKIENVTFASEELTSRSVTIEKNSDSYTLADAVYVLGHFENNTYVQDYQLPLSSTTCDVTGLLIRYTINNTTTYEIVPVKLEGIDTKGAAAQLNVSPVGGANAGEAVGIAPGGQVTVTPVEGFATTLNSSAITTVSTIPVTGPTSITVSASRPFYTTNEQTYYYKVDDSYMPVTVNQPTNVGGSTIAADITSAQEGNTITLSYDLASHYHFNGWNVYKTCDQSTTVDVDANNQFEMPAYPVTVEADIAEDGKYTIVFDANDNTATGVGPSVEPQYANATFDVPGCNTLAVYAKRFAGWKVNNVAVGATYTTPAEIPTEATTITFVAQWEDIPTFDAADHEWQLVTSDNQLVANNYYLIASTAQGKVAGDISSQVMAEEAALFSEGVIAYNAFGSNHDKSADDSDVNVAILQLGGEEDAWTFTDALGGNGLLGATAAKKLAWGSGTTTWSIGIGANNNNATIQNGTSSNGSFRHNVNDTRFTTYTSNPSSTMLLPQLYVWAEKVYKLRYDANTGTNAPEATIPEEGEATVTDEIPTAPTGKIFDGWNANEGGDGASYEAGDKIAISGADVTIYAQWRDPESYTVSYNANGGTLIEGKSDIASEDITEGEEHIVKANVYEKEDFVFGGWEYAGNVYQKNDEVVVTEDITFVAKWVSLHETDFVLVTDINQLKNGDKVYIVAANYDRGLGAQDGDVRTYVEIGKSLDKSHIVAAEGANTPVEFTLGKSGNDYTFYAEGEGYLYSTTVKKTYTREESFAWAVTITAEGVATISAEVGDLKYNSQNPRFTTYASGQQALAIYKKLETLRTLNENQKWGTICPAQEVIYPSGASFYKIAYVEKHSAVPYKVFYDEIGEGENLEAGQPYLFIADDDATAIKGVKFGTEASSGINDHGFIGVLEQTDLDVSASDAALYRYYIVYQNEIRLCGEGGFRVGAERAYLDMMDDNIVTHVTAQAPGRRRVCLTNDAVQQMPTEVENVEINNAPRKVMIDGQIYIIRGEKRYDVRGQLVK